MDPTFDQIPYLGYQPLSPQQLQSQQQQYSLSNNLYRNHVQTNETYAPLYGPDIYNTNAIQTNTISTPYIHDIQGITDSSHTHYSPVISCNQPRPFEIEKNPLKIAEFMELRVSNGIQQPNVNSTFAQTQRLIGNGQLQHSAAQSKEDLPTISSTSLSIKSSNPNTPKTTNIDLIQVHTEQRHSRRTKTMSKQLEITK